MALKQLTLELVWPYPILIFISGINLWSYFPFLPLPFLSSALYTENLIISPRSSAPLTFTPNTRELRCIPKRRRCCWLRYLTLAQRGVGHQLLPPTARPGRAPSTLGCPGTAEEGGISLDLSRR